MAALTVKMKATEKRAEDVSSEQDGLQAYFQKSQRGQDKISESITRVQVNTGCFSVELKETHAYMEHQAEEESYEVFNDLGFVMAEGVFDAQQLQVDPCKMAILQYTSDLDSWLEKPKRELEFAVSGPAILTDYLKVLLTSFREGANSKIHVDPETINEFEVKSPGEDDLSGPKIESPEADDPAVENPKDDKLDADNLEADN